MRTALRTYNPIPSLQKSEGNAQDAPRIKSALKGAFLPFERGDGRASVVDDIIAQLVTKLNSRVQYLMD
jgi:Ino eighty subunit 1